MSSLWGPPRLIALDIDGTIMNGFASVSPRVVAAVRKALAGGAQVVLATGRPVITTRPVLTALGITAGNVLCSNGAVRMDVASGAFLALHRFDARPVVDRLRRLLPGAVYAIEQPGAENLVTGQLPLSETAIDRVVDHRTLVAEPITRLTVYWAGHTGAELAARMGAVGLPGVTCMIAPVDPWLVAVSAGISKGAALEALRLELDIPADATLAVGDGDNDLEMLRWAGYGVAMGQAPDFVKAAAREVTGSIEDDGLAALLERWYQ
ncbi:MAG TPA: HAD hydrolase family protein [Actinophytocola sp.]|uniref:HAD family hydrolase n=1 Tax=Actinophytocola sp. TaxID=1872138 RepID=UPI002DDD0E73|nr:HAD hydrolase family protein [Actinophytocola sp.]HEV2778846.1 HAD hydrolase family protein [Actinophytocola sp.]